MSDTSVEPVAQSAPGMTQMQRVISTFTAPSKTFADIKNGHKSWWMPFVILLVVSYAFFGAVYQKVGMRQVVENQIHMSPKMEDKFNQLTPDQRDMQMKISLYATEGAFLANPLLVLAGVAVLSLGLMATINFIFGGKARFGSLFAVWMYASLPGTIKAILGIVVLYAGTAPESFNVKNFAPTNLGAFLNPAETNAALYSLASSIDAITIWTLVLLSIGTAMVAGVKRSSGYIAVFGWWAIFVLLAVGWHALLG